MIRTFFIGVMLVGVLASCTEYTPKPRGYMRLEPEASRYLKLPVDSLPYSFYVSDRVTVELPEDGQQGWINLAYDEFNAKIYCSYLPVTRHTLPEVIAENQKLIMKISTLKNASAYQSLTGDVSGILYELEGNVASPIQFYLTDSVSHFFRGALYYNSLPNADSIAPMTDYLRGDIVELISTFSWNN